MKNLIKKSFIVFILLNSISGYCQQKDIEPINMELSIDRLNSYFSSLTSIDLTSKELVGSSYINKDFLPGKISNQETVYSFRYNAYKDEMEVQFKGKSYYLPLKSYYFITFININKVYQVLECKVKDITNKGFFVVISKGEKMSLFRKEKIKFYEEVPAKLGFKPYEPPKLDRVKDKLYFGFKNNTAIEIPKKKKDILKLFTNNAKEVESYAKKNKLRFKKQKDLVEIVKYYNSL